MTNMREENRINDAWTMNISRKNSMPVQLSNQQRDS